MEQIGAVPAVAAQSAATAGYYQPPGAAIAAPVPATTAAPVYAPLEAGQAGTGAAAAGHTQQPGATVGSKRSYHEAAGLGAGGVPEAYKRQQLEHSAAPAVAAGLPPGSAAVPRETVYRLVVDVVDTALIIGRGGNTVRQIESATSELHGRACAGCQHPPAVAGQLASFS